MATINHSAGADIIVPSNSGTTYRGLAGDDTYILSNSIAANATITIVDTSGSNKIQLVDGLSVASSKFAADAVQLTLSNGAVVTINGASNFSYDVGGNATAGVTGSSNTLAEFAASMGVATLPASGSTDGSSNVTVSGNSVSSSASPAYTLTKSGSSVDEGSELTFTITASSAVTSDTAFSWTVIGSDNGGTVDKATAADLDAQSGTATISSGATSTTFSVKALADSAGEGIEGIKVSVFDPNSATVGSHTILINNSGAAASAQSFTGTTSYDAFSGGTGDDTFTFTVNDSLDNTDVIDGGDGTDTLVANILAPADGATTTRTPNIENVEVFKVKNTDATANEDVIAYDLINTASTFSTLYNDNSSDSVDFLNLQNIPGLVKLALANSTTTVDFEGTALTGTADTLNVEILGTDSTTLALTGGSTLLGQVIETVSIKSDSVANTLVDLQTTGVGTTSLVTTGPKQLTITAALDSEITSIDASGMTGLSGLSLGAAPSTAVGITATGSGGKDTIYGSAGVDNISSGGGNDTVNLGTIVATDIVDGGAGTDTVVTTATISNDSVFAGLSNVETLSLTGAINATLTAETATFDTIALGTGDNVITLDTSYGGTSTTVNITTDTDSGDTITNSSASTLVIVGEIEDLNGASNTTITASATNLNDELQLSMTGNSGDLGSQITGFDKITISDLATGNTATTLDLSAYATAVTIDASALDATDAALTVTGSAATKSITYTGSAGVDIISGSSLVGDNISTGTGNDSITATAGNNTIDAGAGVDTIAAGTGKDHISAGAGNDIIQGGAQIKADDTIDGGDGTDTLEVTGAVAYSTILGGLSNIEVLKPTAATATTLQTPIAGLTTINFADDDNQTVTFATGYTGAMTVSLTGDSTDNQDKIVNTAGIDLTVSGYGLDFDSDTTITGGAGTDSIVMTNSATFSADLTNVTGVESITVNDFTLNADATITTGAANLSALTIDTTSLDAGENSVIDASSRVVTTTINAGNGTNTLTGGTANDIITGGTGVDTIDGNGNSATLGADNISAGAGNDIINVSTAETEFSNSSTTALVTDTVDGGAGTDTLAFGVAVTLTTAELANISNIESVTLQDTSSITLSDAFLTNNPGVSLSLGAGTVAADSTTVGTTTTYNLTKPVTFITSTGNVNFTSGTGDDNFITSSNVLDASDTIAMGAGTDTITVRNNTSLIDGTGNAATVVLGGVTGVETVLVQDLADTDTAGNVNISTATAYKGTSLTIDASALDYDSVTPANSEVATIDVSNNAALEPVTIIGGDGLDVLTGGTGADNISGAGSNDSITGGGGADTITGGVGVDTLEGSGGLDNIDAGAGNDIIKITTNADFQTTGGTETVDGGAGTDTLSFAQNADTTITAPELSTVSNIEVIDVTNSLDNKQMTLTLSQAFMDNNNGTITIDGNEDNHADADHNINASTVSTGSVIFQMEGATTSKNDTFTGGGGDDKVIVGVNLQTAASTVELENGDILNGNGGTDTIEIDNRGDASTGGAGGATIHIDFDDVTNFEKIVVKDADGSTTAADAIRIDLNGTVATANVPVTFEVDASVITDADDDLQFNYDSDNSAVGNSALTTHFTLKGGAGDDIIYGSAGSDTITTGSGSNVVVTGGASTVNSGAGGDHVTGGTGVDNVTGGAGADTINAEGGNDIIDGGSGNDIIDAGAGADAITGGTGLDNITTGAGNDTVKFAAGDSAGATTDVVSDFTATTATGVEGDKIQINLTLPAGGITYTETDRGDSASTAEAPGFLGGVRGDFVFIDGTETLSIDVDGDGNINVNDLSVKLTGETAFAEGDLIQSITGGTGADSITLGAGIDTVNSLGGNDTVYGGAGADIIDGGGDDDHIYGEAGADSLTGGAGADSITAGAGNDTLEGDAGIDNLLGGAGDDVINGDDANDIITGGEGADIITAGAGLDGVILTEITSAADVIVINAVVGTSEDSGRVAANGNDNDPGDDTITGITWGTDTIKIVATALNAGFDHTADVQIGTATGTKDDGTVGSFLATVGLVELNNDINNNWAAAGNVAVTFASPSAALSIANLQSSLQYDLTADGAANDIFVLGAKDDILRDSAGDLVVTPNGGSDTIYVASGNNTVKYALRTDGAATSATLTGADIISGFNEGLDILSFDTSAVSTGAAGNKAITVFEASGTVDVDTANNAGVFVLETMTIAEGLTAAATAIEAALTNAAADDSFIIVTDDGTDGYVIAWDDRSASGGDGDGVVDAAELWVLAKVVGISDFHGGGSDVTGDFTTY